MPHSNEFTPFDFFRLAKEAAEHEVEMKIKLAKAPAKDQTSSTNRP
jgi:hypothetical protein